MEIGQLAVELYRSRMGRPPTLQQMQTWQKLNASIRDESRVLIGDPFDVACVLFEGRSQAFAECRYEDVIALMAELIDFGIRDFSSLFEFEAHCSRARAHLLMGRIDDGVAAYRNLLARKLTWTERRVLRTMIREDLYVFASGSLVGDLKPVPDTVLALVRESCGPKTRIELAEMPTWSHLTQILAALLDGTEELAGTQRSSATLL